MQENNDSHTDTHNDTHNDTGGDLERLGKQTWEALKKLHGADTSSDDRAEADRFLSKYLPNQTCCWQIFTRFLTTDNVPHEAHFFAANMLRSKIQRNLHEVPLNFHEGLHEMIMKSLINFNKKGEQYENVRTQLSIALALLAIQRTDWNKEVENIINKLAKIETLDILLNILTRLPEELYTFHIPVSPKIKKIASQNLRNHGSLVLKLLHELFQMVERNNVPNKITIKLKIFKCFAAWLDFMDDHFEDYIQNYTVLTKFCFTSLNNDQLFKEACTCISKILRLSDGDTRRYYDEHENDEEKQNRKDNIDNLMEKQFKILVPNIINLKSMYNIAVDEGDKQKCYGLTRLFVDTAEHYTDWIIQSRGNKQAEQLINIILDCSGHSDQEISTYCCLFWEKLFTPFIEIAREFKRRNPSVHETYDEFDRPWPDWAKPYVSIEIHGNNHIGLIPTIIPNTVKSAKLPIDFEDMDRDEQEDILHLRWQLADIIGDICQIIGLHAVFNMLSQLLEPYCCGDNNNNNNNNNNDDNKIYECEAILFCIRSTYRCDPKQDSDNHPLRRIFGQISRLSQHITIKRMAIELISQHSNFIKPSEQIFIFLYQYILSGLNEPRLQRECVRAIRAICDRFEANQFPENFIRSLFDIYSNKSYNLHIKDQLVLIEAITILISTFNNIEHSKHGIKQLLQKPQEHLKKLLKQQQEQQQQIAFNNKDVSVDGISLYDTMNCISMIFKHFKPIKYDGNSIGVKLLEEIWSDIKFVLTNYTENDGIMEKTTRIIKHVIRNGGARDFMQSNLCIQALKLLTHLYCNKSQRSSFLYIIWIYVDEYIDKNKYAAKELMDTLLQITQCTFSVLTNDKTFNKNSDIVEDFYELLTQYLKKSPSLLIQNVSFLKSIFERAIYGLLMDHTKSHEAICDFFEECTIFAHYKDVNDNQQNIQNIQNIQNNDNKYMQCIDELLSKYGDEIIMRILRGLSGEVRFERAQYLAALLNTLYKYDKKKIQEFITKCIQNINVKSQDPSKQEFIKEFFDYTNDSKRRIAICMDWFVASDRYLRSRTF